MSDRTSRRTTCDNHQPQHHRDGKPAWCRRCGKDEHGKEPQQQIGAGFQSEAEREREIAKTVLLARRRGER